MPISKLCEQKQKMLAFTTWQAITYGIYLAIVYKIELPDADKQGKALLNELFTNEEKRDQLINCLVEVEGQFDKLSDCAYPLVRSDMVDSYIQQLALAPLIYLTISLVTALTIYGGYKAGQLIKNHTLQEEQEHFIQPQQPAQQQSEHAQAAIHSPAHTSIRQEAVHPQRSSIADSL